ncbi:MAG: copper chaperone PCu(A)C [Neisseria sp.]|nr:copper chaperone PCu(A)C [Neisseria sp.]
MKKIVMTAILAAAAANALAAGVKAENAWARETVQGMKTGGVFLEIENDSKRDDVLIGASTTVSSKVEVHEHVHEDGMMKMREVAGGVALLKGKQVDLKPGGYHVMLMGLKKQLKAGDTFPLTLKFKHAKAKTVTVKVKSNAGGSQAHEHHDHSHHGHDHSHHNHGDHKAHSH